MYFNFTNHIARDWWDRRAFLNTWWRAHARDRRWTPPTYGFLYNALVRRREPFINACWPSLVTVEAITRRAYGASIGGMVMPTGMGDAIVAQALALHNRDNSGATAFLAMPAFANDEEVFDRLLQSVWQNAALYGAQRLVAPVQLAPAFSAGLLMDHFHLSPPLHTPYNAPFMPELMEGAMTPLQQSRLWYLEVMNAPALPALPPGVAIAPFDALRLADDLLPLAQAAAIAAGATGSPTADEIYFTLRMWLALAPETPFIGRLMTVDGAPAAFYLAQADVGRHVRRLRGGRPLWARAALALRPHLHATEGRVLLAAAMVQTHGRGVVRALLNDARAVAARNGWRTLIVGPLAENNSLAAWLADEGAIPRQRYTLFVQEG